MQGDGRLKILQGWERGSWWGWQMFFMSPVTCSCSDLTSHVSTCTQRNFCLSHTNSGPDICVWIFHVETIKGPVYFLLWKINNNLQHTQWAWYEVSLRNTLQCAESIPVKHQGHLFSVSHYSGLIVLETSWQLSDSDSCCCEKRFKFKTQIPSEESLFPPFIVSIKSPQSFI